MELWSEQNGRSKDFNSGQSVPNGVWPKDQGGGMPRSEFDGVCTDPSDGLVFGALSDLNPTCSCHRQPARLPTPTEANLGCFSMDSALRRRRSSVAFD